MLTDDQVAAFISEGFVRLEGAFPRDVAAAGREILWRATGCDPADPATWTRPVIRLWDRAEEPFARAVTAPVLLEAFDQLVGAGRWFPRKSLGSWPIRFPSPEPPGDTGWHVDVSFPGDAAPDDYLSWRVNVFSKGRALLMLFLFSDVDTDDAPTRIRVGSHRRLAAALQPFGAEGTTMFDLHDFYTSLDDLPEALATGKAGDVYLCHPFLIHSAQPNRIGRPKFMAQPPLLLREPCVLDRPDGGYSPVEQAIRRGLENEEAV
ncbi:phytanoyl-CoA dioxygenase family protein [Nocardia sp. NPDC088792]|uniref:phytanoyl-CoA dioxygenase family protein n=1 Tax=Nocardia sp. NPDC088792 TaxID=3364332 RepID=UPI0037F17340